MQDQEIQGRKSWVSVIESRASINDRYRNVRGISPTGGEGTFSLVFAATDLVTKKRVALKFFNPVKRGDDYRERCFERESKILASLQGQADILQLVEPRTVFNVELTDSVTGAVVVDQLHFHVTELALSNAKYYIYEEKTTPLRSLTLFRGMCRAVQRIHARRICHRDLKPDNFFRVASADTCLGDFGAARAFADSEPPLLPRYDSWRGDRLYTAPELFAAMGDEDENLFYCGDMFSLGAILFEMFTKNNLITLLFDPGFQLDLLQHFLLIDPLRRREVFGDLVGQIAQQKRLPDIHELSDSVPNCIRIRLNRLYKGLANLDYRRRTRDFWVIFTEINRCVTILRNEQTYQRLRRKWKEWGERRERRREEVRRRHSGQGDHSDREGDTQ